MSDEFQIDLRLHRVVHTPTGCAYSFPDEERSGDLQLWQVVEIGTRTRYTPERAELRKMAFDLYLAAKRGAARRRASAW